MNKFTASKSTFNDDIGRNGEFQNFNYLVNNVHNVCFTYGVFQKADKLLRETFSVVLKAGVV